MKDKIYLVEDDENINELVMYALKTNGYEALGFYDYETFKSGLDIEIPSLVILDVMLPNISGIEILKRLKSNSDYRDVKVIMLTAKNSEIDKLKGFEYGADDYVTKPFSVLELLARIKAVIRRGGSNRDNDFDLVVGEIKLNASKRNVVVGNIEIELTRKEFDILKYLMEHNGFVVNRESLITHLWGYEYEGETRTVDIHITSIRKKLGSAGECIKTIRGVGYKVDG